MSVDDRDWYRERQKKVLDNILGESSETSKSRISTFIVFLLLFVILFAVVDYSRKGFVWQFIEREGKFRHFDRRSDTERKLDAQVDEWKKNKSVKTSACKDDAYASAEDISQFSKKVDLFLKKVAIEKKRYQVENVDLSETQASLESISREGNALISFYNQKLVACYANQITADRVSKKAAAVNASINDLTESFKKISAEK
jgi:hypothetical protein